MKRSPDQHMEIFNTCHAAYVRSKFSAQQIRAISLEVIGAPGNAVESDNRDALYVAHFEMAGRSGLLGRRRHPNRGDLYRLFVLFFCEFMVMPSDKEGICKLARLQVQEVMGIKEGRFWQLHGQVRRIVGQELERRQMYPPGKQLSKGFGESVKSQLKEANLL